MTIRLWDPTTGEERGLLREEDLGSVPFLCYSPSGMLLASGGTEPGLRIWDVDEARLSRRLIGHEGPVRCAAFHPTGLLLASGGSDTLVGLWDPTTGEELAMLRGHRGAVYAVAFSPDGRLLASAGEDFTVRVWELDKVTQLYKLLKHRNSVESLAFSPDGELLASGSWDRTICVWHMKDGSLRHQLRTFRGGVKAVRFTPDGQAFLAAGGDRVIHTWRVAGWRLERQLAGHRDVIFSLAVSPNGRLLASGGGDKEVWLWDLATGRQRLVLRGHQGMVLSVAFSPDGTQLATASSGGSVLARPVVPRPSRASRADLGLADLEACWDDLGTDLRNALRASRVFVSVPELAVPFLRDRLRPAAPVGAEVVAELIDDLLGNDPARAQTAREALRQLAGRAEPGLRRAIKYVPHEKAAALYDLIDQMSAAPIDPRSLRILRAIEILVRLNTEDARQLLSHLASGAPDALITGAALAALDRLDSGAHQAAPESGPHESAT